MGDPEGHVMARPLRGPLRRSFSDHIRDSTARALDAIWKNTRERRLAEIEAKEACDWLRVTGFPQYAQLYEDLLFPVDIALVKREHDFLDRDAIEALCRRLNTLNKCAVMKLEISPHRKRSEDSDEDEPCAISGKWTFQRDSKRWSRLEEFDVFFPKQDPIPGSPDNSRLQSATSHESMLTDLSEHQEVASVRSLSSTSSSVPTHAAHSGDATTPRTNSVISVCSSGHFVGNDDSFSSLPSPKELSSFSFSMKGHHEKNTKSKTRSLLKRMESLKLKGSHHSKHKAPSKLGLIISAPILQEGMDEAKLKQLNCVEISALNGNHINVPMVRKRSVSNSTQTSSSSSQSETSSAVSTPSPVTRTRSLSTCNKRVGMYLEGFDPFSQSTLNNVTEQSIQQAMRYLRNHCLDQVGLFRKSGVKSRIQALRQMNESAEDNVNYEGQSAYDVADMLKQYFRDLPEPLMTNKLSETFLQIYQYVPKDQRLQAIKAAIMLLPDENREVLQTLLYFLSDVTAAVKENQMTPTNLAVCLAPSLFHLNTLKRENSSPRVMQRKQSLGKPDQKDLNENLAATQGLAHMIAECKKLFQVPEEMSRCRNSYTEQELKPLTLEALGHLNSDQPADYRHFLQDCVDGLFKEVKEKFKGWVSYPTSEQADLSYKKVSEGPPLRLWRSTIEVPTL